MKPALRCGVWVGTFPDGFPAEARAQASCWLWVLMRIHSAWLAPVWGTGSTQHSPTGRAAGQRWPCSGVRALQSPSPPQVRLVWTPSRAWAGHPQMWLNAGVIRPIGVESSGRRVSFRNAFDCGGKVLHRQLATSPRPHSEALQTSWAVGMGGTRCSPSRLAPGLLVKRALERGNTDDSSNRLSALTPAWVLPSLQRRNWGSERLKCPPRASQRGACSCC